ncbi:winged helix-turn-helix domain-containing protein [Komagataeibacter swingsii]|uniref:Transcriptional regulator n=1 Tax=Komagataeibacter swingsii TaxID=215220 RepID=A0A2V4RMU1_9PROT|nr:LysR family transcriptional regulator [Komagataeibacter swingsii]AHI26827.1 transcriptional regulator for molybdenum transport ModE/MopA [Komagataeibacter xylinus E25]RFO99121.1 transcriptional regulator [Komagataeibacter xylinus]NVN36296.1 LysR family transcriptional regulator [Komagataeibacter swingsii]PYD69935.1 transcriptional regulator [Komagataeibacter swingsii]RFO99836.1 transcriptional regulator [Komagataeibacter xylinus]
MTEMRLTLRVDANGSPLLGHGKIKLLEQIGQTGSISAAARAMGMSYRRAWLLVEAMNTTFVRPLVSARPGGGGGAGLSPEGEAVLRLYREIEHSARVAVQGPLETLAAMCSPPP